MLSWRYDSLMIRRSAPTFFRQPFRLPAVGIVRTDHDLSSIRMMILLPGMVRPEMVAFKSRPVGMGP